MNYELTAKNEKLIEMPRAGLRPCPFCGSEAKHEGENLARCSNKSGRYCFLSGLIVPVAEWNRRKTEVTK